MIDLAQAAIPLYVACMVVEPWLIRRARQRGDPSYRGYAPPDTAASLAMGMGYLGVQALTGTAIASFFLWLWEHRWFDFGTGPAAWMALFIVEDCTYYWWHRLSHEIRLFWAAHVNHHSSERFNFSTALRQSWTTSFTGPLVYWILPLIGFHPAMIAVQKAISLVYQFWIHTEVIDRMPAWFEAVMNTPSHHRVHHGSNVEYLDRNHAGILIVWDKLFGTFAPEREPVVYGLTKNIHTFNPVRIAFHEWAAMLADVVGARSWRERAGYLLRPPGWSPDGSTLTADQMRARRRTTIAPAMA